MEFQYIEQLCEYSRHGDLKSIQYLLREHKEFDRRRIRKAMEEALFLASEGGYLDIVQFFVEYGVTTTLEREDKRTALQMAIFKRDLKMVECLIANGANLNVKDESQLTPLHVAAYRGSDKLVEYLLKKGAEVNEKDEAKVCWER
ncbi:unnamed protein product [Enterobius vermicularis]|uniref:ANK_REP_REGION domain-containing protein n=1 Tax=Enterobius vermicularis TaxID=51028 RepID=A0A0N4V1R0_ENTVE|nr:unnamed protein product [Enterobius vermicularis]